MQICKLKEVNFFSYLKNFSVKYIILLGKNLLLCNPLYIYISIIHTNVTYCLTVWGNAGKSNINQIIVAQKKVVRTIRKLKRFDHTNDSFAKMKILKFTDLVDYCSAVYVYKSIKSLRGNKYFRPRENTAYNLRNNDLLTIPLARTTQSQQFISFRGTKLWNSLPVVLKNKASLHSFKSSLKSYYIARYNASDINVNLL